MKAVREEIGNTTVLIQTIDDDIVVSGETPSGPSVVLTSVEDEIQSTYAKVKAVIKGIAEDIGAELKSIGPVARPKQVEMEFNFGISAQTGLILILSGKGEYSLKVKMTWELETDELVE